MTTSMKKMEKKVAACILDDHRNGQELCYYINGDGGSHGEVD